MNYDEALNYITNTSKFGINMGLKRISSMLRLMGNPERSLKCIHVAGTNGKGSVAAMTSSILQSAGFNVGLYTSPHLQRFTERIRINGYEIPGEKVAVLVDTVIPVVEKVVGEGLGHPTEFEIITAMAFKYFHDNNVDYAVIEVGLGGRLDSTNVINPLISVITTIGYDHMGILGDTLGSIAYEKAGIIKEEGIVVTYPQDSEVMDVIKKVSAEKHASLYALDEKEITLRECSMDGQIFDLTVEGTVYNGLSIRLLGEYQLLNAKTAVTAIHTLTRMGIDIGKDAIYDGLKNTCWPGRLEVMGREPLILLDGAHNLQGITGLKDALKKYFSYDRLILVIGVLRDKQVEDMCRAIMPLAEAIVTVAPNSERAMSAGQLASIASCYCKSVTACDSIDDAYKTGRILAQNNDLLLFCGSLYMIGHIRTIFKR